MLFYYDTQIKYLKYSTTESSNRFCRRFKKKNVGVILVDSRCVESSIRVMMGLVVLFGIDKTPLSDVSELFLREIKWTANPDGPLSMPTPPTKQPETGEGGAK